MFKTKIMAVLCAALLLTGRSGKEEPRDDLADYSLSYSSPDFFSAETEFPEYDGSAEEICVFLTNSKDEKVNFDFTWRLEKETDEGWRFVKFTKEQEYMLVNYEMPRGTVSINCVLKDNIKLPLSPGHYRLWVGGDDGRVPAEFTIKE